MTSVLIHYAEVALKGRNRPWFISMLTRSVRRLLEDLDIVHVRSLMGRIEVQLGPDAEWQEVRARLSRLPGISNFSLATHVPPDLEAITDGVLAQVGGYQARSFRISARRADKRFPTPTPDIERAIGRVVQDATGWPVDLKHPELVIRIELLTNDAFFSFGRETGTGGLPVGTSGRVLALLSGGIDSPVAAWRLIRRGCRVPLLHFHSYPILSRTSQDKARELAQRLARHQLKSRLFLVPFGAIQQQVVVTVPPPMRVVVYRRLMMRIAERVARDSGAQALVTGEVVGQVASQTIDNLAAIQDVTQMPILRPLIGMDKEEITAEAQRLDTYSISIVPDEDCCTLFTPRFPATRATIEGARMAETGLDVDALVEQALAGLVVEDFRYPVLESRVRHATPQPSGDHS